jgi:hypothetical protein
MPSFGDRVRRGYGWRSGFRVLNGDPEASAVVSKCGRILTIKGYCIDQVDTVEGPFENSEFAFLDCSVLSHMKEMTRLALDRSKKNDTNDAPESTFMAFLRTITANLTATKETNHGMDHDMIILQDQLERLLQPIDSEKCFKERMKSLTALIRAIVVTLRYRCYFTTNTGLIGVGPYDTQKGDCCVALSGGEVPFVLRNEKSGQLLVGDCYIHGIMNGEFFPDAETYSINERIFVLH